MLVPRSITLFLVAALSVLIEVASARAPKIGIIVEKENTATYEETLNGFREQLKQRGVEYDVVLRNAYNDRLRMANLAKSFAEDKSVQVVVILGSAAATIGSQYVTNKPVVFGGVNHPERLGIAGQNVTGTTYYISPLAVINLILKMDPRIQRIGLLFEPEEQNRASLVEVPAIEKAAKERRLVLIKEIVRKKESIQRKTKIVLEQGVEVLIIPTNKILYSNVGLIRPLTDQVKVPIVSFSRKGVLSGALIGLTSDNRKLGEKMGRMLMDIVERSSSPKEIEWHFPERYTILINEQARAELGVQIPRKIYSIATKVNAASR